MTDKVSGCHYPPLQAPAGTDGDGPPQSNVCLLILVEMPNQGCLFTISGARQLSCKEEKVCLNLAWNLQHKYMPHMTMLLLKEPIQILTHFGHASSLTLISEMVSTVRMIIMSCKHCHMYLLHRINIFGHGHQITCPCSHIGRES